MADRDVARIGATLCDALEHAHARGVIHRDVKPQNVMVLAEPAAGAGFAKLTDFGVAHVSAGGDPLTRTGDVVGTLAYMAPEQAEGVRVTPACDVYSLALTLYEAWTGSNPVRAEGPGRDRQARGPPAALARSAPARPAARALRCHGRRARSGPRRRPSPDSLRRALEAAEPELSDQGGLVEPETQRRFGLTAVTRSSARPPLLPRVAARAGAGAGAGLLVLAALTQLGPEPSFSAAGAAAAAGLLCALLPRIGWLTGALFVCGWLASPDAGREGTALVLALACAPVPFLLPRAGLLWSLPAVAPLLGVVALGPAFIGLAALAPTHARRAGLAAAGFLWLALAETLTGEALLFGVPDGTLPARGVGELAHGRCRRCARATARLAGAGASARLGAVRAGPSARGAGPLPRPRRPCRHGLGGGARGRPRRARRHARRHYRAGCSSRGRCGRARGGLRGGCDLGHFGRPATSLPRPAPRRRREYPAVLVSVLRNLEAKLGGLVEGAFGRAFKSSVQPVELAHKLAKEMEDNQVVSVSRVYVPNHYRVFLSAEDREQFLSYEPALRKELSDYLLEHARSEGLALTSRPQIDLETDERLGLGEFGIQAELLSPPEEEADEADSPPSSGDFGHTMVYSPDRAAPRIEPGPEAAARRQALLVGEGRRNVLSGARVVMGRSRECDIVVADPNVSRRHAELRREGDRWSVVDLGSTNGIKVNGRRVDQAALSDGDRVTLGVTEMTFELD